MQPAKMYYTADSTVVLMTVALAYKLVLVLIGIGILKANTTRLGQVEQFIENYRCAGQ